MDENGEPETEFEREVARMMASFDEFKLEVLAELREIKEALARIRRNLPD